MSTATDGLGRKLTARAIAFEKHDNAFVELADVEKANEWAWSFWRAIGLDCLIAWLAGSIPCSRTG